MLQIKCVVCAAINNIPMQPESENQTLLCYDCDKQLAGGSENPHNHILSWSIYDDCTLMQGGKSTDGKPAITHYFD